MAEVDHSTASSCQRSGLRSARPKTRIVIDKRIAKGADVQRSRLRGVRLNRREVRFGEAKRTNAIPIRAECQ
jgi:hypothetical protein